MLRLLGRTWRYLVAALTGKLDERADPKVQIDQAIDEAKRRHQMLSEQAAAVLGQQRELELKLGRQIEEVEKVQASTKQALVLADQARSAGDEQKATGYEQTATAFANQLVTAESNMKDLKTLHDRSVDGAEMARKAVEQNAFQLQKTLGERARLMSQLEQAKLQERMNDALKGMSALEPSGSIPSLEEVRQKIESRYAKALGAGELASGTVEARMVEVEKAALDAQGAERLAELRKQMELEKGTS